MYSKSMFIFRRDLRLSDNRGLLAALANSKQVIACFIFDPAQITTANKYKSNHAIQFMVDSLTDLSQQLKQTGGNLYLFYGKPTDVINTVHKEIDVQAVFVNKDYTPFSQARDATIAAICKKNGIDFVSHHDALLNPPEATVKKDGKPYTIFTPYHKNAQTIPVAKPMSNKHTNYYTKPIANQHEQGILATANPQLFATGGRQACKSILNSLAHYKNYETDRNLPAIDGTTGLSAHLKFGTCSVREIHQALTQHLGAKHPLIRQLYWRDFFTHIAYFFPHVFGHAFNKKYEYIAWSNNHQKFNAWCTGQTGFPIIDAGMRQLNETGWMHNRVRMIVASFLVKDLHIDWRLGEQYFATKLVDYDPAVNNGNWQWAASTGCDAQPYFRIFNPWLQQKNYDPVCTYIKKWVPELASLTPKEIHTWAVSKKRLAVDYPKPIVAHKEVSKIAINLFKT